MDRLANGQWFLAQLKPNCAGIAQRNLDRQGIATFLPFEEKRRERAGRFVTALRPLFPGYLFVAPDPAHPRWRAINSTQGITRLLSFGGAPAPLPEGFVDELKERCDPEGRLVPRPDNPLGDDLSPGDKVTLTSGPFARFIGEIEAIASDQRIRVLLDMLGRPTRVTVGRDGLRAV